MGAIIVGAGGHGRVVLDIFRQALQKDPVGFVDANPSLLGTKVDGIDVIAGVAQLDELSKMGVDSAIVAIGDNSTRNMYAHALKSAGLKLINAVHPKACVADTAKIGSNVVIAAGAVVCAHCRVGESCIINTASIVDHESYIGSAAHVCPGARIAGRVCVEDFAFIGIGSTVIQCLNIGRGATIGAGAVVLRDVEAYTTVVGVPAICVKETPDAQKHPTANKSTNISFSGN